MTKSLCAALFAVVSAITISASAKRVAPAIIAPISKSGVTYSLERESVAECPVTPCKDVRQRLIARKSGRVVWTTELYRVAFDKNLEIDVQEIYPRSMKYQAGHNGRAKVAATLTILDERAQTYVVDAKTGALISPAKSVLYVFGSSSSGFLITEIQPGSIYEKLGWKIGDRIVAVNDKPLLTADDIKNLPNVFEVDKTVGSKNLIVTYVRDGEVQRATYTIN